MGQPVTVYRWDDVGAPQIVNRTPSEVIDILTKCLVDGYGAKDPLGWSRPFYDGTNHVAAFRNSVAAGGSGSYLKIWDASGTNAASGNIRVMSAVSMTDIDTLINPGFFHTSSLPSTVTRWVVIGTATAFYMLTERTVATMAGGLTGVLTLFAGDLHSVIPNDAGRFVTLFNITTSGDTATPAAWNNNLNYLSATSTNGGAQTFKIWDADGGVAWRPYGFITAFNTMGATAISAQDNAPVLPQIFAHFLLRISNQSEMSPGKDRLNNNQWSSQISPLYRGLIPGMLMMRYPGYRINNWPTTFSASGNDFWLLPNSHVGAPCVCIQLGEWHDPFVSI